MAKLHINVPSLQKLQLSELTSEESSTCSERSTTYCQHHARLWVHQAKDKYPLLLLTSK